MKLQATAKKMCMGMAMLWLVVPWAPVVGAADDLEQGQRIYMEGILPSGAMLTGTRLGTNVISGAAAACVNCHRRSGMGSVEGDIQISPITGNFLFSSEGEQHLATMDPRVSKRFNQMHEPYTDESLAKAILQGVNSNGRKMNVLMPHYELSAADVKVLTTYLKQLSAQWSPGVTEDSIRFAVVITPDVEPERRKALIDMMRIAFNQKNGSTMTAKRSGGKRQHMVSAAEMVLGTERTWQLDVWELQGAPEGWGEQLVERYRSQPVFALVSGVSNSTWQPVHDFCEREHVPCWFPSVPLPVATLTPYSLYFSRGAALEADVLARYLLDQKSSPRHLVQIYRDDEIGRTASRALAGKLSGSAITVENRVLRADLPATDALKQAVATLKGDDVAMFWLRPQEIQLLATITPPESRNYFSAGLARAENAGFPDRWRSEARLVYPYELPEKRAANLNYFRAWLNLRKLPLVDEVMQSEVFFALNFLTDTLAEMLNNLYRDYLIERAESMINRREGGKSEQETRDRLALGNAGELVRKHGEMTVAENQRIQIADQQTNVAKSQGTTVYPRLSLGVGQRFASKGGYIVRFADGSGNRLLAESGWIVP